MGTIIERENAKGKIRYKAEAKIGNQRKSKTHATHRAAKAWIKETEAHMAEGDTGKSKGVLFGDALERYQNEVAPTKEGGKWDITRCKKVSRYPIARVPLREMSLNDAHDHMMAIEADGVSALTVIREFALLKTIMRNCLKWYHVRYPWDDLQMPPGGKSRNKMISDEEARMMMTAGGFSFDEPVRTGYQKCIAMFMFALETGMRCGEIASLTPEDINLSTHVANLEKTKNGDTRQVPLSQRAEEIIYLLPDRRPNEKIFGAKDAEWCSSMFRKIRSKAGLTNTKNPKKHIRFHDSRRVFCTNTAKDPSMTVLRLAQIIGHRDIRQLQTYFNDDAADIAADMREYQALQKAGGSDFTKLLQEMLASGETTESLKQKMADTSA